MIHWVALQKQAGRVLPQAGFQSWLSPEGAGWPWARPSVPPALISSPVKWEEHHLRLRDWLMGRQPSKAENDFKCILNTPTLLNHFSGDSKCSGQRISVSLCLLTENVFK